MCRMLSSALLVAAVLLVAGCGGGGSGSLSQLPPDDNDSQVHQQGSFLIHTAASTGFRTVTLTAPDWSNYGFMGFYGARIKQLAYRPTAGYLAYTANTWGGKMQVHVCRADTTGDKRLTSTTDGARAPVRWSPDGTRLLFNMYQSDRNQLYMINADGTNLHAFSPDGVDRAWGDGCWSPDGSKIAFAGGSVSDADVYVCNADGSSAVRISSASGIWLDWSAATNRILFCDYDNGYRIWTVGSDGTNERLIIDSSGGDRDPRFSPDGWKIAFSSDRTGYDEIWVADYDGNNQKQLTSFASVSIQNHAPEWSPDGSRIIWWKEDELWEMNADGSNQHFVKAAPAITWYDWWAPSTARARTLIGPSGTDYGKADPPLGTQRPLAIVSFSEGGLGSAVTANIPSGQETATIEAVPGLGRSVVGAQILAGAISNILADRGPGLPKDDLALRALAGIYPGTVLLLFAADTGQLSSVIALNDQA